ncbi:Asc-type amino acid transporter 1 domain protein [Cooperia oncophora]
MGSQSTWDFDSRSPSGGGPQYRDSFDHLFEGNFRHISQPAVGFYSGLFSFQGWAWLNFITEELINPERNLPLAILISMGICTVVYTLFNIALYTVISPDEMLISPAVAVLFAQKEFGRLAFLMPIFVAISTFGSVNGTIMNSSRLFFCGAREGHMPVILTMINKKLRTPIPSVVFTSFLSLMYLLISGHIYTLINASQCTVWLAIAVVGMALLKFRWSMPNARRPVKVRSTHVARYNSWLDGFGYQTIKPPVFGLLILFSAVPIYVVFIWYGKLPECFTQFMYNFTVFWQKIFMVVDDNKKD